MDNHCLLVKAGQPADMSQEDFQPRRLKLKASMAKTELTRKFSSENTTFTDIPGDSTFCYILH